MTRLYQDNAGWNKLVESASNVKQSASDLGILALQKIQENSINEIDYHNFAMKVSQMDLQSVDFVKDIVYKYSLSSMALIPFDPTNHALIRGLLDIGATKDLLDILKDRMNSQVFLDLASANLLMEKFSEKADYPAMIIVIWEMCVQNHFSSDQTNELLLAYGLHAIPKFLEMDLSEISQQEPLLEESAPAAKVAEEEPKYTQVPYVRNPSHDGFFDIVSTRTKCGLAIAALGKVLQKVDPKLIASQGMQLISDAVAQNPAKILKSLANTAIPVALSNASYALLMKALKSCKTVEKPTARGEEYLPTKEELDQAIKICEEKIKVEDDAFDLVKYFEAVHQKIVSAPQFTEKQMELATGLYENYAQMEQVLKAQIEKMNKRKAALAEVKQEIKDLLEREEYLTYFEKADEIKLKAWLAPRTRAERNFSRMKKWRQDLVRFNEKKSSETER